MPLELVASAIASVSYVHPCLHFDPPGSGDALRDGHHAAERATA